MNGLSWIIYGAGVAGGIKFIFGMCAFLAAIVVPAALVVACCTNDYSYDTYEEKSRKERYRAGGAKWLKRLPAISLAFAIMSVIIPNRDSIYLIGASQAGEQILALQEVQEIGGEAGALASETIKLLRSMVSDQLDK